jgi:hypothetical protein
MSQATNSAITPARIEALLDKLEAFSETLDETERGLFYSMIEDAGAITGDDLEAVAGGSPEAGIRDLGKLLNRGALWRRIQQLPGVAHFGEASW